MSSHRTGTTAKADSPANNGLVFVRSLASILHVAGALGVDATNAALAAGIERELLTVPDASVPVAHYYRLLDEVGKATGNPDLGLLIGRVSYLENMHLSLYLASTGNSLRDWLNMMPSISRLIGDVGRVNVVRDGECFVLQWQPAVPPNPQRCVIADAFLSTAVLQMGSYSLLPLLPARVCLSYPRPQDLGCLHAILGDSLHFGQSSNSAAFHRSALDYPMVHVSTRLYEHVPVESAQIFGDDPNQAASFSLALRPAILRQLPRGECSIDVVARDMNISRRTLQRRLKDRGSNFQQVLQGVKVNLARRYLRDDRLSIMQIAFLLGYADHSTFSAAFKSWQGQTPTEFRRR